MVRPGQFTLRALLVATAFIAAAAAVVQFIRTTDEPMGQFEAALLVLILVCGAVGAIRGHVWAWLGYGVLVDWALLVATFWLAVIAGPR